MRIATIVASAYLVGTACSGSSKGSGPTGFNICGVALSWTKDAATCQGWMDQFCCNQEKACASDSACSSWVSCINFCAPPRQDACTTACGDPPSQFDDLSNCSKQVPPDVASQIPNQCEWP